MKLGFDLYDLDHGNDKYKWYIHWEIISAYINKINHSTILLKKISILVKYMVTHAFLLWEAMISHI